MPKKPSVPQQSAPGADVSARWQSHLQSCGEMGPAIAAHDWSNNPLGPLAGWPATLRSAVGMCVSSKFPMVLWWGPELVMLYNDAYRQIMGENKHSDALGAPGQAVWPEIWEVIGPMLHGVLAGEGATWSEDQPQFIDRHGFTEECYFTFSYSPITMESGHVGGVLCALTETTEQVIAARRQETILQLSGEMSTISDSESVVDRAAAILEANVADLPGVAIHRMDAWPPRVTRGGGVRVVLEPADLARAAQSPNGVLIEQAPDGTAPHKQLFATAVCEPGETKGVAVLTVALSPNLPFDASYRVFINTASVHLAAALSGARRLEHERSRVQALADLDEAKSAFFADVSHELRTPLTLIGAPLADVLSDEETPLAPAHRDLIGIAARNTERLSTLVRGMLDFARIEAGRLTPQPAPVNLSAATAALAANFAPAVDAAGLRFDVAIPQLPRSAFIDIEMWERVVLNLLSNAVKYTLAGSIQVRLRDTGTHAELVVADTGVGIDAEDLPRLFERFYRARNTAGRSQEGCGIGLALVGELLKLLGGTVEVGSEPEVGSVFTVRVPYGEGPQIPIESVLSDAESAAPYLQEALSWSGPGPRPDRRAQRDRPRLLIAEDNADMRSYLRSLLGTEFDVTLANDGDAALKEARRSPHDLILADVMMPGTDGFGLLAAIRADPDLANMPVVMLSARAGEEATAEGLGAGADDYVVKPFSGPDLVARLRANLERARARSRDASWRAAMLSSLTEGVVIATGSGVVLDMNDAFAHLTGFGRAGLPYAPPYAWAPDEVDVEHRELFDRTLREAVASGPAGTFELPIRHNNGRLVWVSLTVSTVPHPDSGEDLVVCAVRDVTRERNFRNRRDAASQLAAELVEQVDLAELQAAAVTGLGELFEGEAILFRDEPGVTPDTYICASGTHATAEVSPRLYDTICAARQETEPPRPGMPVPGLLVSATAPEQPHSVWIEFAAPRLVSTDERALAGMLGDLLATALDRAFRESGHLHTEEHLRRALDGQRTVAHAVGILMERHRLTHQTAFDRLRKTSNQRNIKLRELAERLVETGLEP
ncbi:MAG TPA: ATP-binding protein [Sporichthyaceae bacterium]|jgi:PAS domain S-box-containing protein|nr:ATP-binding protein [Sporichthyaceae bacterium]